MSKNSVLLDQVLDIMKLFLLVNNRQPYHKITTKLKDNGFNFEIVNILDFFSDYEDYEHTLLLLPSLFVKIVDINLSNVSNQKNYNFIIISDKHTQCKSIDHVSTKLNIVDSISGEDDEKTIKGVLNKHLGKD